MNNTVGFNKKISFKQILLASFLTISMPAASLALAEHGGDKGPRCTHEGMPYKMHGGIPPYLHGLDLTNAQKDQLLSLNHAQVPVMRDQHKQYQQLMEEIRATAQAEKFDDVKAQQLADKAEKLEHDQVLTRARHVAKVFALLTPDQRKKAREFKMEKHHFGHRFGHGDLHQGGRGDGNK